MLPIDDSEQRQQQRQRTKIEADLAIGHVL
jgi:hypothetical protein